MSENDTNTGMSGPLQEPPGPVERLALAQVRAEPLRTLTELAAGYGDICRYQVDRWPTVLINRHEFVKHVLVDNVQNYTRAGTPDHMLLKHVLGEGLGTSEGETWRRQRRLTQPAFRRDRVQAFDTLMTDAVAAMLDGWEEAASSGEPLDIEVETTRLTLNVVVRALFGFDLEEDDTRYQQAVRIMNECVSHFDPADTALLRRFSEGRGTLQALVAEIIARRRACPHEQRDDLLEMMLRAHDDDSSLVLTDRQLRDHMFNLIMGGHETTSKTLTWALYLLDQHPGVAERLRAEVDAVLGGRTPTAADLPSLPLTEAIIEETLRIYPPVWTMSRMCQAEDAIGGYRIAAGTLVTLSPYLLHRHPAYWERPHAFYPEHFAPAQVAARPLFAWCPFGGGPRLCIGQPMAMTETRLALAMIAQRFRPRLVAGHPVEPEALVTLRPRQGMPMAIVRTRR